MIPMMNEYKNLIINFVKEHQKGLKMASEKLGLIKSNAKVFVDVSGEQQ